MTDEQHSNNGDDPGRKGRPDDLSETVAHLFADARTMHTAALERLAADDIRDASEKAWCATVRATDGLIVARAGKVPNKSTGTARIVRELAAGDPDIKAIVHHYHTAKDALHGDCFYLGDCEPRSFTERVIHETVDYIDAAEQLANV